VCYYQTHVVACYDKTLGYWDSSSSCYYSLVDPQPPATDPIWAGNPPGGAIYDAHCFGLTTLGSAPVLSPIGRVWLPVPPPGSPIPTPAQLAQTAIAELKMNGPTVGVAPPPTAFAVVGMPVWLWSTSGAKDDPKNNYWGTQAVTVTVPGLSVTATATAKQISWNMGDGNTKICKNPGTEYTANAGDPACTYTYSYTSAAAPDQKFTIWGATTWVVTWSGGGLSGTQTFTPRSDPNAPVHLKVESAQAVNQP